MRINVNSFMESLRKCIYGQGLSLLLGLSITFQDKIKKSYATLPFYFLLIFVHLMILMMSLVGLHFTKNAKRERPKLYIYALPSLLDLLGGITLNKSMKNSTSYLITLITQFIYPMSVFTEFFVFKKHSFNIKKMGAFVSLCLICFIINKLSDNLPFMWNIVSICYALLSNVCYMTVTFLEAMFLPNLDPNLFLRDFSILGIISGCLYTLLIEWQNISSEVLIRLYTTSWHLIILYAVPLAFFYFFAPRYINEYGGNSYNASIITESVYIGIIKMIVENDIDGFVLIGFGVCIGASVMLVSMEKKRTSNSDPK